MLTQAHRAEFLQQPSEVVVLVVRLPWDNSMEVTGMTRERLAKSITFFGRTPHGTYVFCTIIYIWIDVECRPPTVKRKSEILIWFEHILLHDLSAKGMKWYDHGLTGFVGRLFIMLVSLVWLSLLRKDMNSDLLSFGIYS